MNNMNRKLDPCDKTSEMVMGGGGCVLHSSDQGGVRKPINNYSSQFTLGLAMQPQEKP